MLNIATEWWDSIHAYRTLVVSSPEALSECSCTGGGEIVTGVRKRQGKTEAGG